MNDTPAIDLKDVRLRPAIDSLEGRMTVHYTGPGLPTSTEGTWKSIGEWYQVLYKDRIVATPEITAKANELTAGKSDFYDKTEAIAEFVQKQVRYFAIELGIGGYQPHYAGDTFRNRYGDCKDKATLLTAMLSAAGIHATLVIVDTSRGVVDPDAPSIVGNHAIAAIEIPKGYTSPKLRSVVTAKTGRQYLIFDPTWEKTAFGQLEHNLQGGYGVLMEGSDSQVIQFPVLAPDLNTIRRTATFQLQRRRLPQRHRHRNALRRYLRRETATSTPWPTPNSKASIATTSSARTSSASLSPTSKSRTSKPSTKTSPRLTHSPQTVLASPWARCS